MFTEFEVVRLVHGVPAAGVPAGALAVILEVSTEPELHYEIEVTDEEGRTIYQASATPDELEPVSDARPDRPA
jgi:hypothetical protein